LEEKGRRKSGKDERQTKVSYKRKEHKRIDVKKTRNST